MRLPLKRRSQLLAGLLLTGVVSMGSSCPIGLDLFAYLELTVAGVPKYVGDFDPVLSEDIGEGWTRHTFDTEGGDGPTCIAGTPFTTFTRAGDPDKVIVFLQGGGACWQDFYFCNVFTDDHPPPFSPVASGIWVDSFDTGPEVIDNPLADWSIVYVPYCDGSVFIGDNDVVDPAFLGGAFGGVRHHRGLRNLTAAMDLAKATFPHPKRILVTGSSAGGVGAAAFAPFLARFLWGNLNALFVINDAGPIAVSTDEVAAAVARRDDWGFEQFYPASCTACDPLGQQTAIVDWRLAHDNSVREGFYSTDGDATDRFFLNIATQTEYRDLILAEHGILHDEYPFRYKRFVRSGDDEHTALQLPDFYVEDANGTPLYEWVDHMVNTPLSIGWDDIVEDFVPLP